MIVTFNSLGNLAHAYQNTTVLTRHKIPLTTHNQHKSVALNGEIKTDATLTTEQGAVSVGALENRACLQ